MLGWDTDDSTYDGIQVDPNWMYGNISIRIKQARHLADKDRFGKSDPYVVVLLGEREIFRTRVIDGDLNPVWDDAAGFSVGGTYEALQFYVYDRDTIGKDDYLGKVSIPIRDIQTGATLSDWFPLDDAPTAKKQAVSAIELGIRYTSYERLAAENTVPSAFQLRQGCRVIAFQDAHTESGDLPPIIVTPRDRYLIPPHHFYANGLQRSKDDDDDKSDQLQDADVDAELGGQKPKREPWEFLPRNCFEEMYHAMWNAKKFIYITGWSVWTDVRLLRRTPTKNGVSDLTLGELLLKKAEEGVCVLILIWDEKTSIHKGFVKFDGLMGTRDEDTKKYFEGTKVICKGVHREGSLTSDFIFSHHQKTIICDAAALATVEKRYTNQRRIIAFVGGLDLTSGRYDCPKHHLFRSLQAAHRDDFYANFTPARNGVSQEHGPRQPWHDIHCKVEGPIARDVLTNFCQRWTKQTNEQDALVDTSDIAFLRIDDEPLVGDTHPSAWSCQLFRSIDGHVASDIVESPAEDTIKQCYLLQIQRAKRFLYLENQYFLGSSQHWIAKRTDRPTENEIPYAVVQKIEERIRNQKRFCAYIVIPMYPEGVPDGSTVQEILKWQYNTITMMYHHIARVLSEVGSASHPRDYLNFYCLVNRESEEGHQSTSTTTPKEGSFQETILRTRRAMIYVHSKMFISDDEYLLVGSANINDRSQLGSRDTEIAVGCFQPNHTMRACANKLPRGKVHGFRLSLWAEHLGCTDPQFAEPHQLDCVRKVNDLAEQNLSDYSQQRPRDLQGHLIPYPYKISQDGKVSERIPYFWDMPAGATPMGSDTVIPDLMTV